MTFCVIVALFIHAGSAPAATHGPPPVIRSPQQLDAYLRNAQRTGSPLYALSPGARMRFLRGLKFNRKGLTSLRFDDLSAELTRTQAYAILQLFGVERFIDVVDAKKPEATSTRPGGADVFRATERPPITTDGRDRPPTIVETRYDAFERFNDALVDRDPTAERLSAAVSARYAALFLPFQTREAMSALQASDLRFLFRAAGEATADTSQTRFLADMERDLGALEMRHAASSFEYDRMFEAYIVERRFERARSIERAHPDAASMPVPEFTDRRSTVAQPSVLNVEDRGRRLVRRSFDLSTPARIVIVGSPLCHFTQHAMSAIDGDGELRRLFARSATWLVPPEASTSFAVIDAWNRSHGDQRMLAAYARREWPFDRWETPTFYFLRAGRVVREIVGWPQSGRMRELRAAVRELYPVPPSSGTV